VFASRRYFDDSGEAENDGRAVVLHPRDTIAESTIGASPPTDCGIVGLKSAGVLIAS
jgi:hypothetical protein